MSHEVKHLAIEVEWKAVGDPSAGELEGYLAVFNNRDQGGDVIMPGAFTKTIKDLASSKSPLPLLAGHDASPAAVVGSFTKLAQDNHGLKVKAAFASTSDAQSIRQKMVEGHLTGLSIGYRVFKASDGMLAGQPTRFLHELGLVEGSVTPIPMNRSAVASAKSDGTSSSPAPSMDASLFVKAADAVVDLPIADEQKVETLRAMFAAKSDEDPEEKPADTGDGPVTGTEADAEGATSDEAGDAKADLPYAFAHLQTLQPEPRDGALPAIPQPDIAVKQREDAARAEMDELERRLRKDE